ncbi:acyl-phosphate glycerol 3-phosphate acyltransferase [Xylanimonas oleitrophica]|uniref:Acyl-phosphate glycerol 3-phosphate acyltransferase n=1 Tax=Xylanimonas oleitrophica TaxID=2607479 RepID=A0A2W5WLT4_9MICO|nr:1-acyl-sn-glycerol-3-phosphate acyltransferase [Xylanimonas oleitrophica]PZR52160.1 acyl-phosphate glycerol 3-phosphate acyltransferase [Xylanimonas oleitrophica]
MPSLRRTVAQLYWRLSRWTPVDDAFPREPAVMLGAPHTSNWDFVHMLGLAWRNEADVRWLGKHTLFTGWRGPIMRRLGGIPVDRTNPSGVVDEVLAELRAGRVFQLVVTPDGTRSSQGYWKSGFYRIAREAGLPVTLGFVDRTTMTLGIGPTFHLSGDVRADMDRIRAFYADKAGNKPALRAEPRLAAEERPDAG